MKEATLEFLYKFWTVVGSVVGVTLLTVGVLGTKACIEFERDMVAACMSAGGDLIYHRCLEGNSQPVENWRK